MAAQKSVTADELVKALKRRKAALPAEIGTFIIFEACEALLSRTPEAVGLEGVEISEDGVIGLGATQAADEDQAARSLHAALTLLLVAAGPAPTPALLRLVEEGPEGGRWTRDQMRDDLEAALVPLNRTASRRVLSRLVRETSWGDRAPPRTPAGPTLNQLDEELSSFLGVPHIPSDPPPEAAPAAAAAPSKREAVEQVSAQLEAGGRVPEQHGDTEIDYVPAMRAPSERPSAFPELGSLSERAPGAARARMSLWLGALMLVLAGALVAVTLVMRPDALARLSGEERKPTTPDKVEPPPAPIAPRAGDLIVRVKNERAQILRYVGKGPVVVPKLPKGVALEFVAVAEGTQATRALVPVDAEWEATSEGPRYELAMQLLPLSGANLAAADLGDTLLPQNVGTPSAALGSVRIVTTPRGAKVYQVIGFAPEAKLTDVPLGQSDELLIWKRGHRPVSRMVGASDFVMHEGRMVAEVAVVLEPLKR